VAEGGAANGVPVLLTAQELAQRLRVPTARVYELARQDAIPSVRLGRQIRFDCEAVARWIAAGGTSLPGGWRRGAER